MCELHGRSQASGLYGSFTWRNDEYPAGCSNDSLFVHAGVQALTAELTVRFISPVCTGEKLMVCARLLGQRRGIYQLEAWLTKGQQKVARATAKFIVPSQDIALAHR